MLTVSENRGLINLRREVFALYESGELHPFDAVWIARLEPAHQMQAAVKCIRNFNVTLSPLDNPKSCIQPKRTTGS